MPFTRYAGGRKPPYPDTTHPRLWLDGFLPRSIPEGEPADWASAISAWPMDLNDTLGTCGLAGMDHLQLGLAAYGNGTVAPWGNDVILQLYEELGGYKPGDSSTDQGTSLQDNLGWWRKNPIQGTSILGFAALSTNLLAKPERVNALRTFGPLYLGYNLPQSAETQFPGMWDVIPGSPQAGGHCVTEQAELPVGDGQIEHVSWGQIVHATMGFLRTYCEEAWVVIDAQAIERNGANQYGVNMTGMNDALAVLTGETNPLGLKTIM